MEHVVSATIEGRQATGYAAERRKDEHEEGPGLPLCWCQAGHAWERGEVGPEQLTALRKEVLKESQGGRSGCMGAKRCQCCRSSLSPECLRDRHFIWRSFDLTR